MEDFFGHCGKLPNRSDFFHRPFDDRHTQPYPLMEGGIKIEIIKKIVRDPMLLNMIFEAIKIRINQEDEVFILRIERVTVIFVSQFGQNLNSLKNSNFKISLSF